MCCRVHLDHPPDEYAFVLGLAGFHPLVSESHAWFNSGVRSWSRMVGTKTIYAILEHGDSGLLFGLEPMITHNEMGHKTDAQIAGIMFKTAMTLAERSGGKLRQTSHLGACLRAYLDADGKAVGSHEIADYRAGRPLLFENLCPGFQKYLVNGVPQIGVQ